jgi:hypothetical protein
VIMEPLIIAFNTVGQITATVVIVIVIVVNNLMKRII